MNKRGHILMEGVWVVFLTTLSTVFMVELCQRSQLEVVLRHATFLSTRARALGAGESKGNKIFETEILSLLGKEKGKWLLKQHDIRPIQVNQEGLVNKTWVRFPSLISFKAFNQNKHHFEITTPCFFPLSY